jgi:hypothetical protein
VRDVPVREEQQREQESAHKEEVSTEGHAHHRCYDQSVPVQREECSLKPETLIWGQAVRAATIGKMRQ